MSKETGGSAFPVAGSEHNYPIEGMTLRDYFAAKVIQGTQSNPEWNHWSSENHVAHAYGVADDMIALRNK
ncbi:hypothetical protein [Pectobacterium parmentieri]|uniref:hypothetical protein n=1 Tax=Pectobacterium parmentieri TaxID=1905730 RepID=UPI0018DF1C0C|nr:hypothetical protein [Pectobacterium parmentieri]MBI0431660.1 hypothetical protein [Pectobacterium parmentieri]